VTHCKTMKSAAVICTCLICLTSVYAVNQMTSNHKSSQTVIVAGGRTAWRLNRITGQVDRAQFSNKLSGWAWVKVKEPADLTTKDLEIFSWKEVTEADEYKDANSRRRELFQDRWIRMGEAARIPRANLKKEIKEAGRSAQEPAAAPEAENLPPDELDADNPKEEK